MSGDDLFNFDDEEPFGGDDITSFDDQDFFDAGEVPEFPEPVAEQEGVSRPFMIIGAVTFLVVVVIVILVVIIALSRSGELSGNEKTATAIHLTNVALLNEQTATKAAQDTIIAATQTQIANREATATSAAMTAEAADATATANANATATATIEAGQTVVAQTATQDAINMTLTGTAMAGRTLAGIVIGPDGVAVANATLRLYRDDGDLAFTSADLPVGNEGGAGVPGGEVLGDAQPVAYGEVKESSLALGEIQEWVFAGTANDSVLINAIASDPVQTDMFLELLDPNGTVVAFDDDSGDDTNAAITNFALPVDGQYTIRISSATGPGDYRLLLSLGLTIPPPATATPEPTATPEAQDTPAPEPDASEPTQESQDASMRQMPDANGGIQLVSARSNDQLRPRQDSTPPPISDELLQELITNAQGEFDFGALAPGVYWVEVDYASLPPEIQTQLRPGEALVVQVTVPESGPIAFDGINLGNFVGPAPTATIPPTPTPAATITPGGPTPDILTLTPTLEPTATALPETGLFSDIADEGGDIEGSNGLAILAIAGAGLAAVVFIARRLRNSA